jgi:uncharacterized protein YuzE
MEGLNVRVGPLVFDQGFYDSEGDVLYLTVGPPQASEGEETPEGHDFDFAPGTQRIVGLTILNARWLLERDGRLVVTLPEGDEALVEGLDAILQPA